MATTTPRSITTAAGVFVQRDGESINDFVNRMTRGLDFDGAGPAQAAATILDATGKERLLVQAEGETVAAFERRANVVATREGSGVPFPGRGPSMFAPVDTVPDNPPQTIAPNPDYTPSTSALARLGAQLQRIGGEFATSGVNALVDGKALVMVDAARLGAHRAILAGVEQIGGDEHAVKALRVMQSPWTVLAEDIALAVGASMSGKDRLAGVVRERVMRRVVDEVGEQAVAHGASIVSGIVSQISQAVKALSAADAAAELPAEDETTR